MLSCCCNLFQGFKKFLLKGNVIELSVAFVISASFNALITNFVGAFITPLVSLIVGKVNYNSLYFSVNNTQFPYGLFINSMLSFTVIVIVCYFIFILPERFLIKDIVEIKKCPDCESDIPILAKKCKYCTSSQYQNIDDI